jgi:cytochrome c oxidase subunit 3
MSFSINTDEALRKKDTEYTGIHPQKFAMWLGMGSMSMFFAALTSALIVKRGDFRNWENFAIPDLFYFSTAAVVAVSILIHSSLVFYRQAKFGLFRLSLTLSWFAALTFVLLQFAGLKSLTAAGKPIDGTISASFLYAISGMHAFHIVVGMLVLSFFILFAFRSRKDPIYELRNIINPKRQLHLELLVSFWHYIDLVWVYLFIFFKLNYQ